MRQSRWTVEQTSQITPSLLVSRVCHQLFPLVYLSLVLTLYNLLARGNGRKKEGNNPDSQNNTAGLISVDDADILCPLVGIVYTCFLA